MPRQTSSDTEESLDEHEQAQAEEHSRPNALVVHEVIRREGEKELERSALALIWSGLAAGLSMGFSLVTEGLLRAHLPDAPWRPLVTKLGYSVGFLITVLGRQQLFTENTLTPILPLLTKRDARTLSQVLRLWGLVLAANLVGTFIFAWAMGHTLAFPAEAKAAFAQIGAEAMEGGFGAHCVRGVFAGWLIALMVWLLPAAEQSRLQIIVILTYLVGLAGLSHVIVGSVETLSLVTTGAASWGAYFGGFLAPTLLGNILGGTMLVAVLNYGQVAPGDSSPKHDHGPSA